MQAKLQKYYNLYSEYTKKHYDIIELNFKLFKLRNSKNPFKLKERITITDKILDENKNICTLIFKIMELEKEEPFQEILKNNNCTDCFYDEVKDRCYLEDASYLERFLY